MNDNEAVLVELRKISAWADMNRKVTKWTLIFVAVFIPAMILFGVVMTCLEKASMEKVSVPGKADWYDVEQDVRHGDLDEAIRVGEKLIEKSPQFPEGHRRLGMAYLVAGRLQKAREHFAEAVRLLPTEDNEKLLIAVDKRMQMENSQADGPAGASSLRR